MGQFERSSSNSTCKRIVDRLNTSCGTFTCSSIVFKIITNIQLPASYIEAFLSLASVNILCSSNLCLVETLSSVYIKAFLPERSCSIHPNGWLARYVMGNGCLLVVFRPAQNPLEKARSI